jgi:cyclophilin family peptidyl-prolyl cis-trans isomerase
MAFQGRWRNWAKSALAATFAIGLFGGCDKGEQAQVAAKSDQSQTPTVAMNSGAAANSDADAQVQSASKPDKMHLPFSEACTVEINADSGVTLPPTFTINGKNSGELNEQVQKIWNDIKFTTADGKHQTYILSFEIVQGDAALGTIDVLMRPEIAPNHVRNFVALTMLNFYDGLHIDRIVRQQADGNTPGNQLVLLESGSPSENADVASSHLGYWLRPEFAEGVKHEEGTVGACLMASQDNAETAACCFYINLTPAPAMDGNFTIFGKVISGIEIARKIAEQPVRDRDGGPDQGKPVTPITIRKATSRAVPVVE